MLFSPAAARRPLFRAAAVTAVAASLAAAASPADAAESRVRVRYDLTLAGFTIGAANMQAGIDDDSYDMNLSIRMSGLVKFFTGARGAVTSRGSISAARVTPTAFALNTKSNSKGQIVRFALAGGAIRQMAIDPPPKPQPDNVPVTDADKRNIIDPLSAVMMPVAGTGDALSESACDRTLPIFDGRQRYDVKLHYDRMETAQPNPDIKGSYDGKLVVCKASYKPIAGYKPGKDNIVFMENNKDMEVWLAPVAGAHALLPWKISVKTQMGTVVITASSFVVEAAEKPPALRGTAL